mgnify:CR=1 FL=1
MSNRKWMVAAAAAVGLGLAAIPFIGTRAEEPVSATPPRAGALQASTVCDGKAKKAPDFELIQQRLNAPVIFDGRNLYDADRLARIGFTYFPIGRGESRKLPMPYQQWSTQSVVALTS